MWKSININKQNIKCETAKAILIKLPNSSDYKGYCFWHPLKLIKEGKHRNAIGLVYNDGFSFKIFKDEKYEIIDVEEFEAIFEIMDKNIIAPSNESYLKIEEPEKIEKTIEVAECLKNNN